MTALHYRQFLADSTTEAGPDHGLSGDEMYGLYVSWCFLRRKNPKPSSKFWTAMQGLGVQDHGVQDHGRPHRVSCPGLRMTGPAAADYILASRPSLY